MGFQLVNLDSYEKISEKVITGSSMNHRIPLETFMVKEKKCKERHVLREFVDFSNIKKKKNGILSKILHPINLVNEKQKIVKVEFSSRLVSHYLRASIFFSALSVLQQKQSESSPCSQIPMNQ